jgi:predicted nucleic acid-binding protein
LIFVDTNIFIDILGDDDVWKTWSANALDAALQHGAVVINMIVAAELAPQFASSHDAEEYVADFGVVMADFTWAAAFAAGTAHALYRKRGGERQSILADFLIAGHAIDLKAQILTRDAKRYRSYFPDINLITPETRP